MRTRLAKKWRSGNGQTADDLADWPQYNLWARGSSARDTLESFEGMRVPVRTGRLGKAFGKPLAVITVPTSVTSSERRITRKWIWCCFDYSGFRTARTPQLWHDSNKAGLVDGRTWNPGTVNALFVGQQSTPMMPCRDAEKERLDGSVDEALDSLSGGTTASCWAGWDYRAWKKKRGKIIVLAPNAGRGSKPKLRPCTLKLGSTDMEAQGHPWPRALTIWLFKTLEEKNARPLTKPPR